MRVCGLICLLAAGLSTVSCTREDKRRDDSAAREVGRDAYRASQDLKQGAKKAERELRDAGKDIRAGWNEAKHESPPPPPPPPKKRSTRDNDR